MWYKSKSADYPNVVDTESSSKYNYLRRNIEEIEEESFDGTRTSYYEYEEAKFEKDDLGFIGEMSETITELSKSHDEMQAETLLNQMDIMEAQANLDESVALILENILS